jgi:hypothetical protein
VSKHTPGIWIAEQVGDTGHENPMPVYEVNNGYMRIAENLIEADARLIAAAPELLAALDAYHGCHEEGVLPNKKIREQAELAILKATEAP